MWLSIVAFLSKLLDLFNPWSKMWADEKSKSNVRKQQAQVDIEKAVKEDGVKGMDNYWNARSRRKRG